MSYYVVFMLYYIKHTQGFHVHKDTLFNTGIVPVEISNQNFPFLWIWLPPWLLFRSCPRTSTFNLLSHSLDMLPLLLWDYSKIWQPWKTFLKWFCISMPIYYVINLHLMLGRQFISLSSNVGENLIKFLKY